MAQARDETELLLINRDPSRHQQYLKLPQSGPSRNTMKAKLSDAVCREEREPGLHSSHSQESNPQNKNTLSSEEIDQILPTKGKQNKRLLDFGMRRRRSNRSDTDDIYSIPQEPPKEVCTNNRWIILRSLILFHLPSISIVMALLGLYLKEFQWTPPHPTADELSALQFLAKAHESLIMISITEILLYRIRFCLLRGDGIPLGFLSSAFCLVSPFQYLFSQEFWGTIANTTTCVGSHTLTVGTIWLLILIGIGASPFSAIAILPRSGWWENRTAWLEDLIFENQFVTYSFFSVSIGLPYEGLSDGSCGIEGLNTSPPNCRRMLQPWLDELVDLDPPLTPRVLNISSVVSGYIDTNRPVSLSIPNFGVDTVWPTAFATAPMGFISAALRHARTFLEPNSRGILRSIPMSSSPTQPPPKKWKQPVVVANCNKTEYLFDDNPLTSVDTLNIDFYEKAFGVNFTVTLDLSEPELRFINEIYNMSIVFSPGFPDLQSRVPVPISASILMVRNVMGEESIGGPTNATVIELCLIQARWLDSEAWVVVEQPSQTHTRLETPFTDILEYFLQTSSSENIIKLGKEWLEISATGYNNSIQIGYNSTYGDIWTICAFSWDYCFPLFIAGYLTDLIASMIPETGHRDNMTPGPGHVSIKHAYYQQLYAYSFRDSISIPIAFAVLLIHVFIALLHAFIVACSADPWYSSSWGSFGQLITLALRSRAAEDLPNIGGGVTSSQTWKKTVNIREVDGEQRLEMVLDAPADDMNMMGSETNQGQDAGRLRHVKTGKKYI